MCYAYVVICVLAFVGRGHTDVGILRLVSYDL
jgi:hypothetical protein